MIGGGGGGGSFMAGSIVARLVLDKTGWDQAMASVRQQNQQLASQAQQSGAALQAVATKLAILGGAVVGAAAVAVSAFAKFDDAMTQSQAIMGDLTTAMRKDLADAAKNVARITTFTSTQAADALYYLASAGLDVKESIEAIPVVAKFAQAGMFDLEKATTLLADAQTALGLRIRDDAVKNMENMTRVADVLSKANILANASIEEFSEALTTRAGAALRLVGKDIEEGAAALTVMANQGIKGAEAGTRLDIVLRDLQTRAIKNKDVFEKYNVTVFDTQGEMANLADIFDDLTKAMAGMSDEQRRATLMEMDFQDRSVASILALVGMGEEIRRYEKDLRKAAGTTEEIAKKQLQSLKSQIQLTKNEVGLLAEAIGSTLAPVVEKIAVGIRSVTKFFTEMTEGNKAVVGGLAIATAALGALTLAVGTAIVGTGMFLTQWAVITAAAPGVAGAIALVGTALGSLAGGILAVAVGFAAFKLGEWIGKVTGLNKVVQGLASGFIWLGQQVGLVRKPVDELEVSEARLERRHLFLATASAVAGREITNLLEAVKILKKEFAEKGTVGDAGLDEWLRKVTAAKEKTEALQTPLEGLNAIFPGLGDGIRDIGQGLTGWLGTLPGVTEWWTKLGKEMAGLSPEARAAQEMLAEIFKKYDVKSREDLIAALNQAKDDLEVLRASAQATPGAIAAIEAQIKTYRDQLTGFTAAQERAAAVLEKAKTILGDFKDTWEQAAGVSVDAFKAWKERGQEFEIEFQAKMDEESWDEAWKGLAEKAQLSETLVEGILGDLTRKTDEAAYASSEAIQDAIKQMTAGGTVAETKLRIAEITQVLREMGGSLTLERIKELEAELARLKGIVADMTPWGRFVAGVAEAFQRLQGMIDPIISQLQQNQEIAIENEYKTRLDHINKTIMDEEKKQQAIQALEAEFEIKKTKARATAAKQQKAMALAQAIINTAEGVSKALAQGGFIFGPVWAAIVGALGAVQVAAIAAQPIPLAEGATFDKPTMLQNVLTGENRPEHMLDEPRLVKIVREAMTWPAPMQMPAMAAAGGGLTVNFNSPLVQATGYSRQDLQAASEEMKEMVVKEFHRMGRRL